MLNQKTLSEAFELALSQRVPPHDYHDNEHSEEDVAAFDRMLHRATPFETVERKLFQSTLSKR